VATTFHIGDYGGLGAAHEAVRDWCARTGRELAGPSWEVYGHWSDDPAKRRTDVFWLLK
jgi:effector-binding domain-containing protein